MLIYGTDTVLTKNESEVGTYIMGYSNKLSLLRSWVPEDATSHRYHRL